MFAKQGWRFVFYMMAGVAGLTTILLLIFGIEPRNLNAKPPKDPKPKLSSPARGAVQRGVGALKVGFTWDFCYTHVCLLVLRSMRTVDWALLGSGESNKA